MKRNIKIFLTISFFIFGIRQIMLYNDFILSIYLFIISAAIKTANDD